MEASKRIEVNGMACHLGGFEPQGSFFWLRSAPLCKALVDSCATRMNCHAQPVFGED